MAWWLAYEELYGDMDKEYPIMKKNDDVTVLGGDEDVVTFAVPEDAVGAADTISLDFSVDTDTLNFGTPLPGGMGEDHISFGLGAGQTVYNVPDPDGGVNTPEGYKFADDPYPTIGSVDPVYAHHFPGTDTLNLNIDTKPQPNLRSDQTRKYGEDKGISDLKDYVSSTYSGHYTSQNNNVQTLDLIQSVGDAESFCRSNAIKYLSRYDKKGQAKRDILKAMHYCLLLYYFSGQTNETPTRGYETF